MALHGHGSTGRRPALVVGGLQAPISITCDWIIEEKPGGSPAYS